MTFYCIQVTDNQLDDHENLSGGTSALLRQRGSQKAISLPSSPHELRSSDPERSGTTSLSEEMVSTWYKVLDLPVFQKKPLLPFEEWNIDFSELTVGTRVGIGKIPFSLITDIDKAEDLKADEN